MERDCLEASGAMGVYNESLYTNSDQQNLY